jgi:anti-sigma B factor antagonist
VPDLPDFSIDVSASGDRVAVVVAGEVDLATSPQVAAAVEEQLARGPVLVDLRAVTFLDSSGIRVLDGLLRAADATGNDLRFDEALDPAVVQILELTGLMQVLPFERTGSA